MGIMTTASATWTHVLTTDKNMVTKIIIMIKMLETTIILVNTLITDTDTTMIDQVSTQTFLFTSFSMWAMLAFKPKL